MSDQADDGMDLEYRVQDIEGSIREVIVAMEDASPQSDGIRLAGIVYEMNDVLARLSDIESRLQNLERIGKCRKYERKS